VYNWNYSSVLTAVTGAPTRYVGMASVGNVCEKVAAVYKATLSCPMNLIYCRLTRTMCVAVVKLTGAPVLVSRYRTFATGWIPFDTITHGRKEICKISQRLKYNFQGGELFSSPGSLVISCAHVSIAGSQISNDRLNVLSMISCCFFSIL